MIIIYSVVDVFHVVFDQYVFFVDCKVVCAKIYNVRSTKFATECFAVQYKHSCEQVKWL